MSQPFLKRILLALTFACLPLISRGADATPGPVASSAALTNLVFDKETQISYGKLGDTQASFTFQITNVSDVAVHILEIPPSCSCTHAELPRTPWIIQPHTNEALHVTMALNRLQSESSKYLTIRSTNGTKQIWVKSIVPVVAPGPATNAAPVKQ